MLPRGPTGRHRYHLPDKRRQRALYLSAAAWEAADRLAGQCNRSVAALFESALLQLGEQLESEQGDLEERLRLATVSCAVATALIQDDTQKMLDRCVAAFVTHLDVALCRIWICSPRCEWLELRASAGLYTHTDGFHGRIKIGQFKIGLIGQTGEPHLSNTVLGDPHHDQDWIEREGLTGFAGYPLIAAGKLLGVIAFFSRRFLTQGVFETLGSVAEALALTLQRRETEETLRQEARLVARLNKLKNRQAAERQVQELARLNALKDDFLSTVSDELRAPLTDMRLAIEMLFTSCPEAQKNRYLHILQQECSREVRLVNDLLKFQTLSTDIRTGNPEAIALRVWLPALLESFQVRIHERRQHLNLHIAPDVSVLHVDPGSLEQIVVELLSNACKYTPSEGTIAVQIEVGPVLPDPARPTHLRLSVFNSGCVILPDQREQLFEHSDDPAQEGGTGQGLALVRRLVEQLSGTISLESSPEWTIFTVELPEPSQTVTG